MYIKKLIPFLCLLAIWGWGCINIPTDTTQVDTTQGGDTTITGDIILLTEENFESMVEVPGRITMVYFYLFDCPSCIAVEEMVENLASRFSGKALVGKVDCDEEYALVDTYDPRTVPRFIFLKEGVEYARPDTPDSLDDESLASFEGTLAALIENEL